MRLERNSKQQWRISDLVPFELALLREIPQAGRPDGDERATRRLYPGLFVEPEAQPDEDNEWDELVHPSLRSVFESALQRIQQDLGEAVPTGQKEQGDELWQIEVPADHAEAWLSGLNQARLSLAERFDLYDDDDQPRSLPEPPTTLEQQMLWRAALQTELYGYVMEWILENVIDS